MSEAKYQDCYVAFLDILGFKELLKKDDFDEIYSIFKEIKEFKPRPVFELPVYSEIKFHIMSDSIIVYVDATKTDSFISLTDVCFQIQLYLLRREKPILVRGGIARGNLFCEDDVVFGTGLSRAYTLENNLAIYPRIIFTGETLNGALPNSGYTRLANYRKDYYLMDDDELYYIDFLHTFMYGKHLNYKSVEEAIEVDNAFFDSIVAFTEEHLMTELNASVRTKYLWLKKKIQDTIEHMPQVKKHFEEKQKELEDKQNADMSKIIRGGTKGTYV